MHLVRLPGSVCGIGMFIPDPKFFHPGFIRVKRILDSGSASKNLSIFSPKNWFQALGKWSVMFIADPWSRGQKSIGSGSTTLLLPVWFRSEGFVSSAYLCYFRIRLSLYFTWTLLNKLMGLIITRIAPVGLGELWWRRLLTPFWKVETE